MVFLMVLYSFAVLVAVVSLVIFQNIYYHRQFNLFS